MDDQGVHLLDPAALRPCALCTGFIIKQVKALPLKVSTVDVLQLLQCICLPGLLLVSAFIVFQYISSEYFKAKPTY